MPELAISSVSNIKPCGWIGSIFVVMQIHVLCLCDGCLRVRRTQGLQIACGQSRVIAMLFRHLNLAKLPPTAMFLLPVASRYW